MLQVSNPPHEELAAGAVSPANGRREPTGAARVPGQWVPGTRAISAAGSRRPFAGNDKLSGNKFAKGEASRYAPYLHVIMGSHAGDAATRAGERGMDSPIFSGGATPSSCAKNASSCGARRRRGRCAAKRHKTLFLSVLRATAVARAGRCLPHDEGARGWLGLERAGGRC